MDIIKYLNSMLQNEGNIESPLPWYKGFKGKIYKENDVFITEGVIRRYNATTLIISELPIGVWTQPYKEFLETLIGSNKINSFLDKTTETEIEFHIKCPRLLIDKWIDHNDLIKIFKLKNYLKLNLTLFDEQNKLKHFRDVKSILKYFYTIRLLVYEKRHQQLLFNIEQQIVYLNNKVLFIKGVINKTIKVFQIPQQQVIEQLIAQRFKKYNDSFQYLLDIKIYHFTKEKVSELENSLDQHKQELKMLNKKTPSELWVSDLNKLQQHLQEQLFYT